MDKYRYKLVAFDVDDTLVESPVYFPHIWRVLNQKFGTKKEDDKIEARYRKGEINYEQWVYEILSLYKKKGVNKKKMMDAVSQIKPVKGAHETLKRLKKAGMKLGIISGSLDIVLNTAFPDVSFDYLEINKIFFDSNGKIKGWKPTQYGDGSGKAKGLISMVRDMYDIDETERVLAKVDSSSRSYVKKCIDYYLERSVYVGDGRNDALAIKTAGCGILFCPHPDDSELRKITNVVIEKDEHGERDLRDILGPIWELHMITKNKKVNVSRKTYRLAQKLVNKGESVDLIVYRALASRYDELIEDGGKSMDSIAYDALANSYDIIKKQQISPSDLSDSAMIRNCKFLGEFLRDLPELLLDEALYPFRKYGFFDGIKYYFEYLYDPSHKKRADVEEWVNCMKEPD